MLRIVVSASLLASAGAMQLVTSSVRKAVPEDGKQILVEQEGEESQQVVQQEMTITEMCKSCNWDCYLKRYPGLKNKQWEAEHPQKGLEYAKLHYIKYGRASGRSCQCDADMLAAKLVEQPWDAVRLEGQLAEQTEVLAEAAAEVELIKGCDWNCYLDRYPKIRNEKWEQEHGNQDYARSHYLKFGRVAGKNCKCGPGPKNLITGASLLQLPILVEQEADESQQVVQQEMTITEMCKSCNWDCYLKRYPGLKNKQWEAEHPQKGLEYAKLHYVKYGRAAGRSCQCDADMLAAKLVEQPWDAVRLQGQLAEQTEVLAEAAAEVELIKGCDWNCYLDRYPKLRNEKWEQEKGNQDYARSHYLKFGRAAGKNCKCGAGPKNLITGASLLELPEDGKQILVEQEADESQQVVQQEMTITEMCKSCNWDCYLKRYPGLKNKQWEAEHPQKGLEYAKLHYVKYGRAAGRSCQCDADMLAAKLVEQPWDAVRLQGQLAEQTEVLAEAAAEVELIKGCDWNCYLDRYPKIRNEKWEQEHGNQDYARSHYLKFGRVAGKNCKCAGGK